jgi:CRP-like cAMP-binding protein
LPDAFDQFPLAIEGLPPGLAAAVRLGASVVRARAGRILVSPELPSTSVYLVAQGRLQVALFSTAGHEVILRDLSAGEVFGELAAIDQRPRSASIVALDDCVLISLPGPLFRLGVYQTPEAAEWLARRLAARIRDLTVKVFELNALRVPGRLHCELLRLFAAVADEMSPPAIDPAPTHAELAARIGSHREAITREMGALVRSGIILQQQRRLIVLDLPALAGLVGMAAGRASLDAPPVPEGAITV